MTIQKAIDDLMLRWYGGAQSDDTEIPRAQVAHWLTTYRDSIVKDFIDKNIASGFPINSYFIERETCKTTSAEDLSCVDESDERIYFSLTKQPMSLINDSGVVKVITDEGLPVLKTTLQEAEVIKDLKYSKPTSINLVYYRDGLKIVIMGLRTKNLTTTDFIVHYIPSLNSQTTSESTDLLITDDLLPLLLDSVEEIGRRELFGLLDMQNNGAQPNGQPTPDNR